MLLKIYGGWEELSDRLFSRCPFLGHFEVDVRSFVLVVRFSHSPSPIRYFLWQWLCFLSLDMLGPLCGIATFPSFDGKTPRLLFVPFVRSSPTFPLSPKVGLRFSGMVQSGRRTVRVFSGRDSECAVLRLKKWSG